MLNTSVRYNPNIDASTDVDINATSGTLVKHFRDSFFIRFRLDDESQRVEGLFERDKWCRIDRKNYSNYQYRLGDDISIVILQVMLCGAGLAIAEVIKKEDFDKLYICQEESLND